MANFQEEYAENKIIKNELKIMLYNSTTYDNFLKVYSDNYTKNTSSYCYTLNPTCLLSISYAKT